MINNRLFLFITLLTVSCGMQASPGLNIETQIERVGMIQYLPINMVITFTNESPEIISLPQYDYFDDNLSFVVEGSQDFKCRVKFVGTRLGDIKLLSIPPGQKHVFQRDLSTEAGLLHPGTYQVRVVWDSRQAPKGWKGYAESDCSTVVIEDATGVDKLLITAVKAAYPKANWACLIHDASFPEEIANRYPASIYYGLKLLGGYSAFSRPWFTHEYFDRHLKYSFANPDKVQSERSYYADRIEKFRRYLVERPDFYFRDSMRIAIAFYYAYNGKYDEASKELSKLIQDTKDSKTIDSAKELLSYIEGKNYMNDQQP